MRKALIVIAVLGLAAVSYAIAPTLITVAQFDASAANPVTAGKAGMWRKTSDDLPYWTKADTTVVAMTGGGSSGTLQDAYTAGGATGGDIALDATGDEIDLNYAAIGSTVTAGLRVRQSTAATLNNQKYAPTIFMEGHGWETTGGTSQKMEIGLIAVPIQNTTLSGEVQFWQQVNSSGGATYARLGRNAVSSMSYLVAPASNMLKLSSNNEAGADLRLQADGFAEVRSFGSDGAAAFALKVNTNSTWSNATAKILTLHNGSSEKAFIDKDGKIDSDAATINLATITVDATAGSDGDVMTYDTGTTTWAAAPAGGGGGAFVEAQEKLCLGQAVISSTTFGAIGNGTTTGFAQATTGSLATGDYTICFYIAGWWSGGTCEVEHSIILDASAISSQTSGRTAIEGAARQGSARRCMPVTFGSTATHTLDLHARLTAGSVGNCAIDGTSDATGSSLYWEIYSR